MYVVHHWWGAQETQLPAARFAEILAELKDADDEHPDVSLKHESEWTLSYGRRRVLVFENVAHADAKPRHMKRVSRKTVIACWRKLAEGNLAWLERQPWRPGYGS